MLLPLPHHSEMDIPPIYVHIYHIQSILNASPHAPLTVQSPMGSSMVLKELPNPPPCTLANQPLKPINGMESTFIVIPIISLRDARVSSSNISRGIFGNRTQTYVELTFSTCGQNLSLHLDYIVTFR